jgi:hypothetical protein
MIARRLQALGGIETIQRLRDVAAAVDLKVMLGHEWLLRAREGG